MTENEPMIMEGSWDQVLFMGTKNFELKEFRVKIPCGTGGHSKIYFKHPTEWRLGFIPLPGKEDSTNEIENSRIRDNLTVFINGKKTLIVLADIKASNMNKSFLDSVTWSYKNTIEDLERKNETWQENIRQFGNFLKRMHLERTYMGYLMSAMDKGKKMSLRVSTTPTEQTSPVTVEVGKEKKK